MPRIYVLLLQEERFVQERRQHGLLDRQDACAACATVLFPSLSETIQASEGMLGVEEREQVGWLGEAKKFERFCEAVR